MLEGITVLSESTVSPLWLGIILIIIGVLAIFLGVMLIIIALRSTRDYGVCAIPSAICIVGLASLIAGVIQCGQKPEIEYKVTIDDTVNFKEFNNRYTIIDQDGDIYTIIKKENK